MAASSFYPAFPVKHASAARQVDRHLSSDTAKIETFRLVNTHSTPITVALTGALTENELTRHVVPSTISGTITGYSADDSAATSQTLVMAAGSSIDFIKTSTFDNTPEDGTGAVVAIKAETPVFTLTITHEDGVAVTNQVEQFIGATVVLGSDAASGGLQFDDRGRNSLLMWNQLVASMDDVATARVLDFLEGGYHTLADLVDVWNAIRSLSSTTEPVAVTLTALAPPAGGTGATAGAMDTAQHRDDLIASVTALRVDTIALKGEIDAIATKLANLSTDLR